MPKLLVFAACEKVLLGGNDADGPSLISCMDRVTISGPKPPDPKRKDRVPFRWRVFAMWHWLPGDTGKLYTQRIKVVLPSGDVAVELAGQMQRPPNARRANMTADFDGFPIWEVGECQVTLEMKEGNSKWQEIASYPIEVIYTIVRSDT